MALHFPPLPRDPFLSDLAAAWRKDGFELLAHNWRPEQIQFTFRVQPDVAPVLFTQRVKGRLEHALRDHMSREFPLPRDKLAGNGASPDKIARSGSPPGDLASPEAQFQTLSAKSTGNVRFSRKVGMRAIGENITDVVIRYVREQLAHVDLADPRYRATLVEQAIEDPALDLASPVETNSGRYWYNLHLVMVLAGRHRLGREDGALRLRPAGLDVAARTGCAVKALAIMPDHIHIALRGNIARSPVEIGVSFQNALADAAGCRLFADRFYVGTFGEYGLRVVAP
jgi:REP element-mobilizing transposase RayT